MTTGRNVKIVATIGPASQDRAVLRQMIEAGVNVLRLNMSHGSHEDIAAIYQTIRALEDELDCRLAVIGDLQGPKLRCGVFAEDRAYPLTQGQRFRFDLDEAAGDQHRVCLPHAEIFAALRKDTVVLVNDGLIRIRIERHGTDFAEGIVETPGEISDRKGVNLSGVELPLEALTAKDRDDLEFLCDLDVDWIALSFVQRARDIEETRRLIDGRARVIAKIEKPAGVANFDAILDQADGIMVARGDLGVEFPVQSVPPLQKQLVRKCRGVGKPVIIATQMLESMVSAPVPTRAEVSDVATAIYDGVDAVMLSAESASGAYPVLAVEAMDKVAREIEADSTYRDLIDASRTAGQQTVSDAITAAARDIAENTNIKAICCFTRSGSTAIRAARERPRVPIVAITPERKTARQLSLIWGLHCLQREPVHRFKGAVAQAILGANQLGLAENKDKVVVTAGVPFNISGTTNILRVATVDGSDVRFEWME